MPATGYEVGACTFKITCRGRKLKYSTLNHNKVEDVSLSS